MQDAAYLLRRIPLLRTRVNKGRRNNGSLTHETSLRTWGSLLTLSSRQPLRVNGYNLVGFQHANCQQVSALILAALGIRPQRVAASAVHN